MLHKWYLCVCYTIQRKETVVKPTCTYSDNLLEIPASLANPYPAPHRWFRDVVVFI